jgi:hypothetical protein
MAIAQRLTVRSYIITNGAIAALFANLLLFGPALRMGASFTAGLGTGIAAGWIAFAVSGFVTLRRRTGGPDERTQAIIRGAASTAFWLLILCSCLLAALLRSELLGWRIGAAELAGLLSNVGLASYGISMLVLSKRM